MGSASSTPSRNEALPLSRAENNEALAVLQVCGIGNGPGHKNFPSRGKRFGLDRPNEARPRPASDNEALLSLPVGEALPAREHSGNEALLTFAPTHSSAFFPDRSASLFSNFALEALQCGPAGAKDRSASVQLVAGPRPGPFLTEALPRGTMFGPGREALPTREHLGKRSAPLFLPAGAAGFFSEGSASAGPGRRPQKKRSEERHWGSE